jgi:hypothetical protein
LSEQFRLFVGRLQPVAEGALNHRLFLHESNREGNSPQPPRSEHKGSIR